MQFLWESGRFVCRPVICGSSRAGSILGAKAVELKTRPGRSSSNHCRDGSRFSPHGACLLVDEAHSLGVLGERGRGLAEESDVENSVDFIVGTFSKSLGATGGFCVSDHPEAELIRYGSRPYIFTASPCPAVIASTRAALNKLRTEPELRVRLWNNARQLYQSLQEMGFRLGPEVSPIVAARFEQREEAIGLWNALLDQGVYVNMAVGRALLKLAKLIKIPS